MLKLLLLGVCGVALAAAQNLFTVVSAANYQAPVAPASLASVFGVGLASETASAELDASGQLPTSLGGFTALIGGQAAQLLYVSPTQVNLVMPASLASGTVDVVLQSGSSTTRSTVAVSNTDPALFSLDQSGSGPGAILNAVTFAGGSFAVETQANLGDDKRTRLAIYGTGIRYAGNPFLDSSVTNVAGAITALASDNSGNQYLLPVEYAGAAPLYFGLDQINVVLPPQLDGAGLISLSITAGTLSSNVVTVNVNSLPASALRLLGVSLSASQVNAGTSLTGTVTMNVPARQGGFSVSLSSSANGVQIPGSVTIAQGQISAAFTVQTSSPAGGMVSIAAAANGVSRTASLLVNSANTPSLIGLALSTVSVTGGTSLTGTLTLSGLALSGGAVVQIAAAGGTSAQVPSTVTIPFGRSSATFTIPTTSVTAAQNLTLTATYGTSSQSAALVVSPLFTFTLGATSVTAGQSVAGNISLSTLAPVGGAPVRFNSSSSLAFLQQLIIIPGAQNTASVTISTNFTSTPQTVVITATYSGATQTATLNLVPVGAGMPSSLVLSSTSVKGGGSVTGTVTLTAAAGASGTTVALQSSNTLAARVPATVVVPFGQTNVSFTVGTSPVTSLQAVVITASANGVSRTATLTIQ